MKSVMRHKFSEVPKAEIPRSSFDRSHGYKTTFDGGYLVPIFIDEALPGDTFNVRAQGFARLNTPVFPIMDNMFMETFFFAVPYRLIWDNFKKFCGEQVDPGDSIAYTIPTMTAPTAGYANESLHDYMGIPTKVKDLAHSALPLRAYNRVWNEWFRDQNLQDSIVVDTDDGPDTYTDYVLKKRGKRHDYFTSALPWPQKGDAVDLPLGTTAPITGGPFAVDGIAGTDIQLSFGSYDRYMTSPGGGSNAINASATVSGGSTNAEWNITALETDLTGATADLSGATAATINQLRQAFQVQKLLERDARAGTRYIEIIKSHFGVTSPDARVQRTEYLGGGSAPVNISPIAQTSSTDATTPQGNLAAMGTVGLNNHGFTKSFTEHCIIIGLVSVRADLTYQQGLNKMWSRSTRYDVYWPSLANLGEQTILNREIYAVDPATDTGATGTPDNERVFGYQERHAEYRYKPSLVTGKFRSNDAGTLEAWHLSQDFSTLPLLDDTFIQDSPPIDRVVAVNTEPDFMLDLYFNMRCARPMPLYSIPGMGGRF